MGNTKSESPWEDALADLEDMLDDRKYNYCADTCESMHEWIMEHQHVTDKQLAAIQKMRTFGRG